MKVYGYVDMGGNQLRNWSLESASTYPSSPTVGQMAFVNSIVSICVSAGELPVWVPLSREITVYQHNQGSGATEWTIQHNLNTTSVQVQIFDGLNKMITADEIEVTGPNTAVATFNTAQAGRAVVVSGHFDGLVKPTYAYTHYQNSANTSWVITHNLGYNPIVRVFIGTNEVQPAQIIHDTTNQVTIQFSSAQVGYARLI